MSTEVIAAKNKNKKMIKFFSNPIVGIWGSVASLVGLGLAVIFFIASQKSPDLVYSIHPSKNVLIRADIPSKISVLYKGTPIQGKDVVAITLSIWNQGKASIKPDSVLEKVNIQFSPAVNVLEANITKLSRNLIELNTIYDEYSFKKGIVPLSWRILEDGDGGNLQVIYAGSREAEVSLTGVIEGQGEPRRLSGISIDKSPESSAFNDVRVLKWLIPGIIIVSVVITGIMVSLRGKLNVFPFNRPHFRESSTVWISFVIAITPFLLGAIYMFMKLDEWYPPFGF